MIKLKQQRLGEVNLYLLTKTRKILSGFLAFFAVLLIARMSVFSIAVFKTNRNSSQTDKSPQTIKAPQDLTKGSTRNLKWTDQQMTIQKVFLASNIKEAYSCTSMLDGFDRLDDDD